MRANTDESGAGNNTLHPQETIPCTRVQLCTNAQHTTKASKGARATASQGAQQGAWLRNAMLPPMPHSCASAVGHGTCCRIAGGKRHNGTHTNRSCLPRRTIRAATARTDRQLCTDAQHTTKASKEHAQRHPQEHHTSGDARSQPALHCRSAHVRERNTSGESAPPASSAQSPSKPQSIQGSTRNGIPRSKI